MIVEFNNPSPIEVDVYPTVEEVFEHQAWAVVVSATPDQLYGAASK
jgi:hypothetical protein